MECVRRGLCDKCGHVRGVAVMGVLKLFHLRPQSVYSECADTGSYAWGVVVVGMSHRKPMLAGLTTGAVCTSEELM